MVYLLTCARGAIRHVARDSLLLFSISLVEQGSVVVYLLAIENILVSYVVAIKRVNVLLSTLIGCVLFKVRGHIVSPAILRGISIGHACSA